MFLKILWNFKYFIFCRNRYFTKKNLISRKKSFFFAKKLFFEYYIKKITLRCEF